MEGRLDPLVEREGVWEGVPAGERGRPDDPGELEEGERVARRLLKQESAHVVVERPRKVASSRAAASCAAIPST